MKFILTIDTEADNQWDHGRELTVENIRFVPRFQNLCNKYFIKPTYLVTSEICEDDFAKEIFTDYLLANTAEIGAHLHSWTSPPFLDKDGYRNNDKNHAFANELPGKLITEKIKNLTHLIEASFGKRPLSFRSGRYGFDENVARVLAENGYLVDSSVTPFMDWSANKGIPGNSGGPDFIEKTPFPYSYTFGDNSLLEIPITILPTKFPLNKTAKLARYYFRQVDNSIFLKVLRKLVFRNQPLWFRPYSWMSNEMFGELLNEAIRLKLPYIVMMFHSSELMPGCSIYREDEDSISRLYDQLERFFILLRDNNISSLTLTEAARN
ncbi:MAG: hypothetical protein WC780_12375 [Lentimicrobiaceae bacterium]|jgi:peptidoglycan/xylan/chitin deacetylase (PgdA/CDA1 family)